MTDLAGIRKWLEQTSEPCIGGAVQALLDEVERLREENEWLRDEADGYMYAESYTAWERDEAEAEVERLRAEVADLTEANDVLARDRTAITDDCYRSDIARVALEVERNALRAEKAASIGQYQWMFTCSMCGDSEYTSHYFEHEGKPVCSHCKVETLEG
jgi:formylmethanofuran dehydrogenase subunit E